MRRWAAKRDDNEAAIVQALELAGWTVVRVSSPGVMDLLCGRQGVIRLLEVKGKHGRLTPAQERLLLRLRAARIQVAVVRTPEEALAAVA
ncbi:MAG: VRR-NUC domain-containing protein [Myxococcaceae bacterium]|nr:VRR-NUC domain-containing protein [Myxococcaceae bacterium]